MGYSQVEGIYYTEVFAPTTCIETLRLCLSLMASRKWFGFQVEIKKDFLNGHLAEPGYEDLDHPDWVYKVSCSIYGLKRSPCQWSKELHVVLLALGLIQSSKNSTLYFSVKDSKLVGLLTVHVDGLSVTGPNHFVTAFIANLPSHFAISSNEELHTFPSVKI